MNLNEALAWLDEHENTNSEEQLCYITKRPEKIRLLKCGHSFEHIALYTHLMKTQNRNTSHLSLLSLVLFFVYTIHGEIIRNRSCISGYLFKNTYLKCSHTFVPKRKGVNVIDCSILSEWNILF